MGRSISIDKFVPTNGQTTMAIPVYSTPLHCGGDIIKHFTTQCQLIMTLN